MRVYLACTVRGDRAGVEAARVAAARLGALGHDVLTEHLLSEQVEQAEAVLPESEVFARDRRWLDECDLLVAEASGSTYGVGFEVGYVSGHHSANGRACAYRTLADVERIIDAECPAGCAARVP